MWFGSVCRLGTDYAHCVVYLDESSCALEHGSVLMVRALLVRSESSLIMKPYIQ